MCMCVLACAGRTNIVTHLKVVLCIGPSRRGTHYLINRACARPSVSGQESQLQSPARQPNTSSRDKRYNTPLLLRMCSAESRVRWVAAGRRIPTVWKHPQITRELSPRNQYLQLEPCCHRPVALPDAQVLKPPHGRFFLSNMGLVNDKPACSMQFASFSKRIALHDVGNIQVHDKVYNNSIRIGTARSRL